MTNQSKTPVWFWIIGGLAVLWNAAGVAAYFSEIMMSAEQFAALDPEYRELFLARPFWFTAAFAIAVFAGLVGSILLLLRKKLAVRVLILSLLGVLVQFSGYFILDGYFEYVSSQGWLMPAMIVAVAALLVFFSRHSEKQGVLK